jgi:hypothetical protein
MAGRAGCDCLGSIHYFDALMANSKGALSEPQHTLPAILLPSKCQHPNQLHHIFMI